MNKPKTNYKEILRLYCSRDYSLRGIAKALQISRNTVDKCLDRVAELQLRLPIPESMTNEELTQILFPPKEDKNNPGYCAPDYEKWIGILSYNRGFTSNCFRTECLFPSSKSSIRNTLCINLEKNCISIKSC